jgi:DNA modification methylase
VRPYYEHAGITIYHGDAADVLESLGLHWGDKPFDLLLTDPPYGIDCARAIHCTKPSRPNTYKFGPKYESGAWDDSRPAPDLMAALLAVARQHIIWGGNYFADMLPPSRGWLFWDKLFEHTTNFSHGELAWTSLDQRLMKFTLSSKAETAGGKYREHPTQKPEALIEWCFGMVPSARSVFDPFMGSGTTLATAKRLGLTAVGVDLEERYCEMAVRRLRQEALPLEMSS